MAQSRWSSQNGTAISSWLVALPWLLHLCNVASAQDQGQVLGSEVASATNFEIPPAPVLRPLEELETIQLADGYRLELVAADPLIQDPIAITFDPDGRLWVCEMRGFMPDIDGTNEEAPVGVISVLDDTDGNGVMDKCTVFLGGLVLPRGLCWTLDGMLVCENGTIWLCSDENGDDLCDEKRAVCSYNPGNLEHSLNGLMPALDNWVYNAKEGIRLRRSGNGWVCAPCAARGQWGITQDNHGYLYYNVNASLIRGDLVPCYSSIAQSSNPLVDVPLFDEQVMYPIRPTPGINRGYIEGFLRPDGSLVEANSNCGPVVYRGDNLPPELLGNVFIPEPAGNLVRRQVLVEHAGRKTSHNAYQQKEFLASTDERFRPVNMFNGPDGTLYIVDMYRGIIQHGAFITSYLRKQILDRELDQGVNLGRIWRVVHDSTQERLPVEMTKLTASDLVPYLSYANGWQRDMAQRLLVQRGDLSVIDELQQVTLASENPLGRLHALWTLEGLRRLDPELLFELLADADEHVRASAVTLYGRYLANETMARTIIEDVETVASDESQLVRLQVVQTLGLIDSEQADLVIEPILASVTANKRLLDGLLSGFAGQESEFLTARLNRRAWKHREPWREMLLRAVAGIMWRQRNPVAILKFCHLLDSLSVEPAWQQIALLEGIQDPPLPERRSPFPPPPGERPTRLPPGGGRRRPTTLRLEAAPEGLDRMRHSSNSRLAAAANAFADRLIWPGKDGKPLPEKRQLTAEQLRLFDIGHREYSRLCAGCHHASGYGLAAKGPPLLGSEWLEDERRLIRLVLNGIEGPLTVNGDLYNGDNQLSMPAMMKTLDDEKIAGVLTFIRREFIDDASPVEVETVADLRALLELRTNLWTERELMELVE